MTGPEKQHLAPCELLATLSRYEEALHRLLAGWDTDAYTVASMEFDLLSVKAASFPQIQVRWMEVLISRHELMHSLWSNRDEAADSLEVRSTAAKHLAAMDRLRIWAVQLPTRGR